MQEQIFINCASDDLPFVEEIKKRLDLAGLSFYVPPANQDPITQNEMVEKIKSIASAHGCMLNVLSNKAVANSLFISNIQLMCESARTRRVLVNFQAEHLENDQGIRLFASQAYQVTKSGYPAKDISRIIQRIHRVLNPPTRNIFQYLSQHISRKALIRLFITALFLGIGGAILSNALQPTPAVPQLPTPTPMVLYVPFSRQSQDAGLAVSTRQIPEFKPDSEPALAAPFTFKPAYILEQDDFSNPAFDQTVDDQKWMINYNRLESASGIAVNQANGVLQLAVAPTGVQTTYLTLNSKYSFNQQQVTYLAYRFRVNDYQGRVQENTFINERFVYQYVDIPDGPEINFDGISQKLSGGQSEIFLGTRWHTLEMVSQANRHMVDVYLDGKKTRSLLFDDEQLARWTHYTFSMYISNTSDWVSLQIDEVIFGADQPIPQRPLPEDAPYRFSPDTVALHEDFSTQSYQSYLAPMKDTQFVTQSNGMLSFRVPAGKENPKIQLLFPTKPINENNYYATRFRFTSPDDDYWAAWEDFALIVENQDQYNMIKYTDGYDLSISALRHEYAFKGSFGINNSLGGFPFRQNTQPGNWHTLEMIIKPPADSSQPYIAYFWVDGYLLGEKISQPDPARLLNAKEALLAGIQIYCGSYRQDVFSGDIDDLVIGTIASDKIKE
jgi:hypothetical protein